MKQHRAIGSFSIVESIKTAVIFLLIVLMLVLVILLVIGQSGTREETLPQADRMVVYASGVESIYASGMEDTRVSPYLMAYRQGGGALHILHAFDSAQKPYEALYPLLRSLFGADAVGYAVGDDEGDAVWQACIDGADAVYVRYNGALPASVIRAYTYSEEDSETAVSVLDERAAGAAAYVEELFFVPAVQLQPYAALLPISVSEDPSEICAVVRDDAGAVTLYTTRAGTAPAAAVTEHEGVEETDADGTAAENPGALDTCIASMVAQASGVQTGAFLSSDIGGSTAVSLDGLYSMPILTCTPYDAQNSLYAVPQTLSSVLGLLGMRESDTDNYYTDGAGDRIYLNAAGRLTVSDSGAGLRYVALQDGGLDLADYLGYASIGGDYLLSEYLRASDQLLSRLEALDAAFGGEALDCTLCDVRWVSEQNTELLVLTYGYTCRGIPLLDENGDILPAMVLYAGDGVISYLELYPCRADASEEMQYLLPQSVALGAMGLEYAWNGVDADSDDTLPETTEPLVTAECLYMAYVEDAAQNGVFAAEWIGVMP